MGSSSAKLDLAKSRQHNGGGWGCDGGGSDPARNGGGGERAAVAKTVLFYKKGKCDRSSHSRLGSLPTRSVLSGG